MKRLSPASARSTLIIFVILAIVFIAQMSWWIIFQMRNTEHTKRFLTQTLKDEQEWGIEFLNAHYSRIYQNAIKIRMDSSISLYQQADISDPAIYGIITNQEMKNLNSTDSIYFVIGGEKAGLVIFLNKEYPRAMLFGNDKLEFVSSYSGELRNANWLSTENIRINPEAFTLIERTGHKYFKMLAMEGSFFILLIMIGAYMIYRALKRTKEIREEQLLFVHSITHELKIPITSMNLFVDTLKRRDYDSKLTAELVPKMKEDLARLNQLIDNILQVRKLTDKEINSRPIEFDLSDELERFAGRVRERVESPGGKLKLDIQKDVKILADPSELIRIWESLIDNSLKYRKSETVEIEINLRAFGSQAEIQFIDNGLGIPEGMEKKLFEPFYRGNIESMRTVAGSGLGLYIAGEFVRRNGGEISIRNNAGDGCTVTQRYKIRT